MRRLISVGGLSVGFGFYVAIVSCSDLIEPLPGPDSGPPLGQLITRTDPSCVAPPYGSFVVYQAQGNNHLFRMPAKVGAIPEDISTKLDPLGTGSDEFVNVSPDGDWLLVGSTRFGCNDPCVALVKRDVCTAQVVVAADGTPVPANGTAAVASGGNLVVYPAEAQPHQRDLFVVKRTGPTTWSAPVNLTAKSPGTWNQRPAISDDGTKMVFDCGPDPNSGAGTSLCVMGLDGNGLVATNPGDLGMQVTAETYLAHGDFATDGTQRQQDPLLGLALPAF